MFQKSSGDHFGSDRSSVSAASMDQPTQFVPLDANILVGEMNGLTVQEREKIYDEVHGVANIVEETSCLVVEKLRALQEELSKIPKRDRKAFDRACFLRPGLHNDRKSNLMFLRATRFDPVMAAGLMCRHYEHKLMLFGESRLPRRILVDDLNEAEQALFTTGPCMLLPSNDQVGRGVYLMVVSQFNLQDWMTTLRFAWYQIMSVLEENEKIQRRGVVQVIAFYGDLQSSTTQLIDFLWRVANIVRDWPFRSCGFHFCYESAAVRTVLDLIHVVMGTELRLRQRCHFGTKLEAQRSLLSYGVKLPNCFTPGEGLLSRERLMVELEHRRKKEADMRRIIEKQLLVSDLSECPSKYDVLMGRGKPFIGWEGNVRLSKLIRDNTDRYMENKINRVDKTMIAMKIVQIIQISGGRFIQRTECGWKTIDDKVAKAKVSQGLRAEVRWRISGIGDAPSSCSHDFDDFVPHVKRPRTV